MRIIARPHLAGADAIYIWMRILQQKPTRYDDAARKFVCDRKDKPARLDKGLDEAAAKGWTVVSVKDDWNTVFPARK